MSTEKELRKQVEWMLNVLKKGWEIGYYWVEGYPFTNVYSITWLPFLPISSTLIL